MGSFCELGLCFLAMRKWGDKHLFLTPWTVHDCVSGREKNERIRDHGHLVLIPWFSILPPSSEHNTVSEVHLHSHMRGGEARSIDGHCAMPDHIHGGLLFNEHERHPVPSAPIALRKEFGYQTGQGCICSVIVLGCLFGCWQMKQELLEVFSNCRQR